MTTATTPEQQIKEAGLAHAKAIIDLVGALEVDWDRLEELRDARDSFEPAEVPDDFPVEVIDEDDEPEEGQQFATCGECGRTWDDAKPTTWTPAPAGRCPFEYFHGHDTWEEANPDDAEELRDLIETAGEYESEDDARAAIVDDPLEIEVRSGWRAAGEPAEGTPSEFQILLAYGGPSARICGELDNGEPSRAWLEVSGFGHDWTRVYEISQSTLLSYARCFTY